MLFHGLNKITVLSMVYESFMLKESKIEIFLLSIYVLKFDTVGVAGEFVLF